MHHGEAAAPGALNSMPLDVARQQLASQFDKTYGGFGKAPKFPHPTSLERLLRHWATTGRTDDDALNMVQFTLQRMALGGLSLLAALIMAGREIWSQERKNQTSVL